MEAVLAVVVVCLVLAGAQQNGDLRLVGGTNVTGRVEIYFGYAWGTIDAGTSSSDQKGPAQTVCRQLGFEGSARYGTVSDFNIDPAGNDVPVAIQDVRCPYKALAGSARQHILRCDYDVGSLPDHQRDFAVQCTGDSTETPYNTQVRLVQGDTGFSSSGFVQVYLQGSWGPVCNMEQYDADSACRQLGYTQASDYGHSANYNEGGIDKVDTFYCQYSQPCLKNCYTFTTTNHVNCGTYYDTYFSYVNCTYVVDNEGYESGDESVCSNSRSIIALAVGIPIAVAVFIGMLICCCCICVCVLRQGGNRYESIRD